MSSYNKTIIMGNLTRDPEIKTIGNSTVANVSVAVNRKYIANNGEKREEVTYVDVTFWGKQAEVFERFGIRKGAQIFVEGRLHMDSWEDKTTGQKRSKLKVVGEVLQLLGGKPEGSGRPQQSVRTEREERPSSVSYAQERGGDQGPFYQSEAEEPF